MQQPTTQPQRPLPASRYAVTKTIAPGQPGSLKLLRRFGSALLCVRYRDDPASATRMVTAEVILETRPIPSAQRSSLVYIPLKPTEREVRMSACLMGAKWSESKHAWAMPRQTAKRLHILHRALKK